MKQNKTAQAGNVLIYVLIAVVLFGALSFSLTKQLGNGGMAGNLDSNKAKLAGEELITYATAMKSAAEQMRVMVNVLPNEFSFVKQGEAGYGDLPNRGKVYHPGGGGMNQFSAQDEMFAEGSAKRGWVGQVGTDVEGTQTSGSDVIFTFLDVAPDICAAINDRLYKDKTIPVTTIDPSKVFINGGGDDAGLTAADCAACVGKVSYCVQTSGGVNAFYNVIVSR